MNTAKIVWTELTFLNVLTIIGVWRLFSIAVRNGSVLIVRDTGMPLEVYLVFPLLIIFNSVFLVAVLKVKTK